MEPFDIIIIHTIACQRTLKQPYFNDSFDIVCSLHETNMLAFTFAPFPVLFMLFSYFLDEIHYRHLFCLEMCLFFIYCSEQLLLIKTFVIEVSISDIVCIYIP